MIPRTRRGERDLIRKFFPEFYIIIFYSSPSPSPTTTTTAETKARTGQDQQKELQEGEEETPEVLVEI